MKPNIKVKVKQSKKVVFQEPSSLTPVDEASDSFRKYLKEFEEYNIDYPDVLVKERRKLERKKMERFRIHQAIMKTKKKKSKVRNKVKKSKASALPPIYDRPNQRGVRKTDFRLRRDRDRTIRKLETRIGSMLANPFNTPTKTTSFSRPILTSGAKSLPLIRRKKRLKAGRSHNMIVEESHMPNLNLLEFRPMDQTTGEPKKPAKKGANPFMYYQDDEGLLITTDEQEEEISFRAANVRIHNHSLTRKFLDEKQKQQRLARIKGPNQRAVSSEEKSKKKVELDEDGYEIPTQEWIENAQKDFFFKKKKKKKTDLTMMIPIVDQEGETPIPPPLVRSPPTPDYLKVGKIRDELKKQREEELRISKEKEKAQIAYIAPNPPPILTDIEVTRTYDPNNTVGSRITPPTPPPREKSTSIFTYFNTTSHSKNQTAQQVNVLRKKRKRSRNPEKERKQKVQKVLETMLGKSVVPERHGDSKMSSRSQQKAEIGRREKEKENRDRFGKEYDWEFKKGRFSQRKLNPAYRVYAKRDKRSNLVFYEMTFSNADLRNVRLFQKTINQMHGGGNRKKGNNLPSIGKVY